MLARLVNHVRWALASVPRTPKSGGGLSVWLFRWWLIRFTGPGKTALVILVTIGFLSVIHGFFALWPVFGFLFVLFIFTWLRTLVPPKLTATWQFPHELYPGDSFILRVVVKNESKKKLHDVGAGFFWEENWLKSLKEPASLATLDSRACATIEIPMQALSRGPCYLRGPVVFRVDSTGLMRSRAQIQQATEIAIRPRPVSMGAFPFLTEGASGIEFARLIHTTRQRSPDLLGIREYRDGDEWRDVHHQAWARFGRPMIREYGAEKGQGAILVVETYCKTYYERSAVEPLLRLAAGVALWLTDHQILGRFFINSSEIDLIHTAHKFDAILDALAQIPRAQWWSWPKPASWEPEARPMGPVLAIGCCVDGSQLVQPLIHKRMLVVPKGELSSKTIMDVERRLSVCAAEDIV